jgi:hypothetical protein
VGDECGVWEEVLGVVGRGDQEGGFLRVVSSWLLMRCGHRRRAVTD